MEFKEELIEKLNKVIDNRIKELFEQGRLQVLITDSSNHNNYGYDKDYYSIGTYVVFDKEVIYEQSDTIDIAEA